MRTPLLVILLTLASQAAVAPIERPITRGEFVIIRGETNFLFRATATNNVVDFVATKNISQVENYKRKWKHTVPSNRRQLVEFKVKPPLKAGTNSMTMKVTLLP